MISSFSFNPSLALPAQKTCNPKTNQQHLVAPWSNSNIDVAEHHNSKPKTKELTNLNTSGKISAKEEDDERKITTTESSNSSSREVQCEVEVVSWRERKVRANVLVNAGVETVWNVLTDYERLADFIPNLVYSGRIPCPHRGRIWLEQRGLQRSMYWQIEARVVLDLQEFPKLANGRELRFSMVDGDFKKFEGKWSVKAGRRSSTSILSYDVSVIPRFNFPAIFLERIIRSDLPVNLQALACRAERGTEEFLWKSIVHRMPSSFQDMAENSSGSSVSSALNLKEADTSLSVPTSLSSKSNSKWGAFGKVCRLDKPCMVDEVHLRRYDGLSDDGGAHRCVIASITVKAPVREVWNVLTAYEALPEIVPNLAISKILSRDKSKVRILQEGCKGLLYMVLHARVVLELHEKFESEISFEQVEGDFDSFQGKWVLEQLGNQHTLLKYVVESKMRKETFLSEAILEEVIYEDLPSNLCSIRDFVEKREVVSRETQENKKFITSAESNSNGVHTTERKDLQMNSSFDPSNTSRQRSKVPGLQRDIEVLKAELFDFIGKYGQEGFMPMRKQLRLHGRVDIEKSITRMGGFRKLASMLNLSLAYKHRKPKGYWDSLENLQEEISRFQRSWGMDPSYMPSRKSFERAGRYDIARALEKWGGLQEVSRLLSLELRHARRCSDIERERQLDDKPSDSNEQDKQSSRPYVAQDTQRWLMKLKDLDINWVK